MNSRKAQSAMEYLMTYGWAILIIAIVLAALFSLGVFSSSTFLGTTCIPLSGFTCTGLVLHGGTLTATIGQATGTTWSSAYVFFLPSGTTVPTATSVNTLATNCVATISGGLASGQTAGISLSQPITSTGSCSGTGFPGTPGTTITGQLWALYNTPSVSNLETQLATVTAKSS